MTYLIIILAILAGGIWLLAKIFEFLVNAVTLLEKSISKHFAEKARSKRNKAKARLQTHVSVRIPKSLSVLAGSIEDSRRKLDSYKTYTSSLKPIAPAWQRADFQPIQFVPATETYGQMLVSDIQSILQPNETSWREEEMALISRPCEYPHTFPSRGELALFEEFQGCAVGNQQRAEITFDATKVNPTLVSKLFEDEYREVAHYNERLAELLTSASALNEEINRFKQVAEAARNVYVSKTSSSYRKEKEDFDQTRSKYTAACNKQANSFKECYQAYRNGRTQGVVEEAGFTLGRLRLPSSVPRNWQIDYDEEQGILILEVALPDVVHRPPAKIISMKNGPVRKPLNQSERKEIVPKIHPSILLRLAYELFRNDDAEVIRLLVVNGWVAFDDPRTGVDTRAYTASLMVERNQILSLNLSKINPTAAFESFHGKSAGNLVEIIPVEPTLSLNSKDPRFVDARAVLGSLGCETNLAAMDWQEFEHLIRELFEREFAGRGAEVKITQASRDRGVDAIAFDPDPIHGGKYVIQAKRYTNTVDVSAVRDLCAVVKKEGASRGILVTTSTYGADAYAFANNEPVTLLNGAELLGLLRKHGYKFRIDLAEARKMAHSSGKP
jgi:restriction system protein